MSCDPNEERESYAAHDMGDLQRRLHAHYQEKYKRAAEAALAREERARRLFPVQPKGNRAQRRAAVARGRRK